jgi:predicted HTH transcriptional regulator
MSKLRVFVSSVQKELEAERVAIASLITTDPFLMQHCEPVLWEREPAPARPADKPYLECLRSCQIYILLIFNDYGQLDGDVSATHHEYRLAQKLKLPTLVFLKGADDARKDTTRDFINEIKQHKHTYKRFIDREDLKPELRRGLLNLLKTEFKFEPSADESAGGREQIEASSTFESKPLPGVPWSSLDSKQVSGFGSLVAAGSASHGFQDSVCPSMHARGLLWRDTAKGEFYATAAGLLVFGQSPADYFPQVVLLADAYAGTKVSGKPRGQLNINAPLAVAIESALQFVDKHTFHPTRVVGINNVTLDEYPSRALREALVNAVAHRNYEDASRKIMIEVFTDRVVISSPGYPPAPLTLAKLRRGNYRPCSRNPVIAQTLATFKLMEQRGSGFARMRDAMLNHGLDAPTFTEQDGYFVVTFPGPNGNYDRLKVPAGTAGLITPAVESQLNERQRKIVVHVQKAGVVTRGWCVAKFNVANDTAGRDLKELTELGILSLQGKGRAVRYVLRKIAAESTDNRPT